MTTRLPDVGLTTSVLAMDRRSDYTGPLAAFDHSDAAIALLDGVERKRTANPYTSANGWMATYLGKQREVAIRLAQDDLEAFLVEHATERPVSYGRVMQDFATVPGDVVADAGALATLIRRAHEHVEGLPPNLSRNRRARPS